MQIHHFERKIDAQIIGRGELYFEAGHVYHLERINDTNWQAEVHGREQYIVDIVVEANQQVTYMECDCPYGDTCKHIVATLYAIKEQLQQAKPVKKKTKPALKDLLKQQSKERLMELILTLGKNHRGFIRELELELLPPENEKEAAEALIQQHLHAAQDRSGFIKWGQTSKALKGIEYVQSRVEQHINSGNSDVALELAILCLDASLEALTCGDDSSGDLSGCAEYSIDLIHSAIECNQWDTIRKQQVFDEIEQIMFYDEVAQWHDWQLNLLRACIPLCDNSTCEQQFLNIAQSLEGQGKSEWTMQQLHTMKQQLTASHLSNAEAEQFLQQHPTDVALRERLMDAALTQLDYEKVLKLIAQAPKESLLQLDWKESAYLAHEALQHTADMQQLAYELVLDGHHEYYNKLKLFYTEAEWHAKREQLLDALKRKNSYWYSYFIVEEKQTARILAYCQRNPNEISEYYMHLVGHYDGQVIELFTKIVIEATRLANNRNQYKEVAKHIARMKKAGYTEQAAALIEQLTLQYNRRRAFVEELLQV